MMLGWVVLFLAGQLFLSWWMSHKIRSEADFLVAGRSLPSIFISISLFATWFGAESILGTTGMVFKHGLSGARADPFGYAICLVLLGLLLAPRLWKKEYLTFGDFFRHRFDDRVEKFVIFILFVSSTVWASAQLRAFGQVVTYFTHLSLPTAMLIGVFFVTSYSFLGGLLGDIISDFIQGIILSLGLLVLTVIFLKNVDWVLAINWLNDGNRLSFVGPGESWWVRMERWAVPILGSLVAQESITKLLACGSQRNAKVVALVAAGIYLIVGTLPVTLGLLAPLLLKDVPIPEEHEQLIITLSETFLSPSLKVVFLGSLLAAILSTIDAIVVGSGGLISHNVISPLLKLRSDKQKLLMARLTTTFMALSAYAITLIGQSIYDLVIFASSWGSSGLVTITLFGLWTKMGRGSVAFWTLLVGILSQVILDWLLKWPIPFTTSLLISILFYWVASYLDQAKSYG